MKLLLLDGLLVATNHVENEDERKTEDQCAAGAPDDEHRGLEARVRQAAIGVRTVPEPLPAPESAGATTNVAVAMFVALETVIV